jgi:CDP-diacylglycerol--glycerol-3-phosphate 3-phosphatidyltransferase
MQSKLGEVLNEIGDVVSDMFIYIPLVAIPKVSPGLVCLFVGLSVINEFSGIFGKVLGKERMYDGPMGKSDRAFVIGLGCLIYYFHPFSFEIINYTLAICCLLMTISSFIRLKKALKDG